MPERNANYNYLLLMGKNHALCIQCIVLSTAIVILRVIALVTPRNKTCRNENLFSLFIYFLFSSRFLTRLKHPNCVKYHGCYLKEQTVWVS